MLVGEEQSMLSKGQYEIKNGNHHVRLRHLITILKEKDQAGSEGRG